MKIWEPIGDGSFVIANNDCFKWPWKDDCCNSSTQTPQKIIVMVQKDIF